MDVPVELLEARVSEYRLELAKREMQLVKYRLCLEQHGIVPPDADGEELLEMWRNLPHGDLDREPGDDLARRAERAAHGLGCGGDLRQPRHDRAAHPEIGRYAMFTISLAGTASRQARTCR